MRQKKSMHALLRLTPQAFGEATKTPLIILLDNIRSALNVGSVFRTADAFALEHLYLCGITATPPHREILKTAIGATESVAWTYNPDAAAVVRQLQAEGVQVWVVEQTTDSVWLQDFTPKQDTRYAIVLGNEVKGVSDEVVALADGCLEIPQFGTKHSLNVAVCAGVAAWEICKKMRYNTVG